MRLFNDVKLLFENWRTFINEAMVDDQGYPVKKDPKTGKWVRTGQVVYTGKTATDKIPRPGAKIRVERQSAPGGRLPNGQPLPLYRGFGKRGRDSSGKVAIAPGGVEEAYLSFNKVLVVPGGQYTLIKWLADSGDAASRKIIQFFGKNIAAELESESLYAIYDKILGDWARAQGFDAINFTDQIYKTDYEQDGEMNPTESEWFDLRTNKWWTEDKDYAKTYSTSAPTRYNKIATRKKDVDMYIEQIGSVGAKLVSSDGQVVVQGGEVPDKLESQSDMLKGAPAVDIQPDEADPNPMTATVEAMAFIAERAPGLMRMGLSDRIAQALRKYSRQVSGYPEELKKIYEAMPDEMRDTLEIAKPEELLDLQGAPSSSKPMQQRRTEFEAASKAAGVPVKTMTAATLAKDPMIYTWTSKDDMKSQLDPEYTEYIYDKYDVVRGGPRGGKLEETKKSRGQVEKTSCRDNSRIRIKLRF